MSARYQRRARATESTPRAPGAGHRLTRMLNAALWIAMAAGLVVIHVTGDLPSARELAAPPRSAHVAVYDAYGTLIAERGLSYVGDVALRDLPEHVPLAIMAAEDHRFYNHWGIDPRGLARAFLANMQAGRVVQGGSTITQQLAKNLFLSPERTLRRKVQEAILALWLEASLSKDEILTLYLNRVYFGAGTHGIDAAARRYFGKPASAVDLSEAAMLAGLLKAPTRYAPTANPDGAIKRAKLVLQRMEHAGFITGDERLTARAKTIRIQKAATPGAHYFVDWILDRLPAYIGKPPGRLTVETTLDLALQRAAEQAVEDVMAGGDVPQAEVALVALGPDGSVRAMTGGRSYRKSQFNRAVRARRQPGSAFKPFVFLAALEQGFEPETTILDRRISIGGWSPGNFKDRFEGPVTMSHALAHSLNAATVRLTERIGRRRVIRAAQRMGLEAPLSPHASLPLGTAEVTPLDLTRAYVPMINGGEAVVVNPVIRIRTEAGGILYEREAGSLGRAARREVLAKLDGMLRTVIDRGTGRAARLNTYDAAGKTGTSQSYRDAWFIGYAEGMVAGVWVGRDNGRPMDKVTGGTVPARIWNRFMEASLNAPEPDLKAISALIGAPSGGPIMLYTRRPVLRSNRTTER